VTADSSSTFEFTIDSVVRNAYVLATLMDIQEPMTGTRWTARASFGRSMLEMLVKRIEAKGKLVRAREFYQIQMVDGQSEYTLPSSLMDVYGDGAFIPVGQPTTGGAIGEVPVKEIDLEQWQRLSSQGSTGRPTLYMCYRAADPLTIRVWPIPTAADTGTIRFQVYRFLGTSTDGSKNVDLERYWTLALTHLLAGLLASASGLDKGATLTQQGEMYMTEALGYSHQRTPGMAVVAYRPLYYAGKYRR
jgi:hypothetical protein